MSIILQNIKEIHTGLEQFEGESMMKIFYYLFKFVHKFAGCYMSGFKKKIVKSCWICKTHAIVT